MNTRKTFWLGLAAGLAFGLMGCTDDSGGTGTGTRTFAHLAPGVPAFDILIDGEPAITDLAYGDASAGQALADGDHTITIALAETGAGGAGGSGGAGGTDGTGTVLWSEVVPVRAGSDLVYVAYRSGEEDAPVDTFAFNNSTEGLASGEGRVLIGHGADPVDGPLDPVNVVAVTLGAGGNGGAGGTGGDTCVDLVTDLRFTEKIPRGPGEGPIDVPSGTINVAFNLKTEDTCPPFVPDPSIEVPVTADVVSVLVAVDEDTGEKVALQLWAIVDAGAPSALISAEP